MFIYNIVPVSSLLILLIIQIIFNYLQKVHYQPFLTWEERMEVSEIQDAAWVFPVLTQFLLCFSSMTAVF